MTLAGRSGLSAVVTVLLVAAPRPALAMDNSAQTATLKKAIRLVAKLDDDKAKEILLGLLRHSPRAPIAAQCNLYLGIIALNALVTEGARYEFKKSISIDATVELPINASPKARMVFSESQGDLAQNPAQQPTVAAAPEAPAYAPAPPPRAAPPPAQPMQLAAPFEPRPANHVPAYVVGGIGVAALVGGIIFGVEANSTLGQAKANPIAAQAEAQGAQVGTDGLIADVFYGVSFVGAAIAVALFFTEKPPTDAPPDSSAAPGVPNAFPTGSLVPVPGGAVFMTGGRF